MFTKLTAYDSVVRPTQLTVYDTDEAYPVNCL